MEGCRQIQTPLPAIVLTNPASSDQEAVPSVSMIMPGIPSLCSWLFCPLYTLDKLGKSLRTRFMKFLASVISEPM